MIGVKLSILVPVDFSPASITALREAGRLADRMSASLTLLHVRPISDVRGELSGLLGGTTHKVLAACTVPVVVVPA
jgi:nucleotide-binding universal stress UspA family protein